MAREYITIHNQKISHGRYVSSDLNCSKGIKKYLLSDRLYAEYDVAISELNPSILQIPAVSGVITIAWAFGADIYVEEIDKKYLEYLQRIRSVVKRWHRARDFYCTGEIHTEKVVSNNFVNNSHGLLFTGGVDSLASYIKHRHEKPILMHVWGADIPPDDEKNGKRRVKRLTTFATKEKVPIHIVRTNIPRALNDGLLYVRYGLDWWQQINHTIVLTGVCAPLTSALNIDTLYVASAVTPQFGIAGGSTPIVATKMFWGNTHVVYDNYKVSRQLKIRNFIKDYMKNEGRIFLKICNNTQRPESNCGNCTKCLRTITQLALEGINPNKSGFNNVSEHTFQRIRERFKKMKFFRKRWIVEREGDYTSRVGEAYYWKDMQKNIPETIEDNPVGLKKFFEWFKDFDISDYLERTEKSIKIPPVLFLYVCFLNIFNLMPGNMQRSLQQLLDFSMSTYLKL